MIITYSPLLKGYVVRVNVRNQKLLLAVKQTRAEAIKVGLERLALIRQ